MMDKERYYTSFLDSAKPRQRRFLRTGDTGDTADPHPGIGAGRTHSTEAEAAISVPQAYGVIRTVADVDGSGWAGFMHQYQWPVAGQGVEEGAAGNPPDFDLQC